MEISQVTEKHKDQWLALFTSFQEDELSAELIDLVWSRIMDPNIPIFSMVATENKQVVGLVVYTLQIDTLSVKPVCRITDMYASTPSPLFMSAIVTAFIRKLRDEAIAHKRWVCLQWQVTTNCSEGIKTYEELGRSYRLFSQNLRDYSIYFED